jgi:uncharacterized DUF497 family protein
VRRFKGRFEWEDEKDLLNQRKHGFAFETAALVFDSPAFLLLRDRIINGEERRHAIGAIPGSIIVLTVVHTYREEDFSEIIRIISARSANKKEVKRYVEAL